MLFHPDQARAGKHHLEPQLFNWLRGRIDSFNAMFPGVVEGDVIYLDYIPGTGTRVTINNERKGEIPGSDFNNALMDIWLGEEPADRKLKKAMLGD